MTVPFCGMIVAACDACEKSIIIRSAIIEEEIVAFVFIVVFVVIIFIDERQKSLRVVFFVGLFNSEEIFFDAGKVNQTFFV